MKEEITADIKETLIECVDLLDASELKENIETICYLLVNNKSIEEQKKFLKCMIEKEFLFDAMLNEE